MRVFWGRKEATLCPFKMKLRVPGALIPCLYSGSTHGSMLCYKASHSRPRRPQVLPAHNALTLTPLSPPRPALPCLALPIHPPRPPPPPHNPSPLTSFTSAPDIPTISVPNLVFWLATPRNLPPPSPPCPSMTSVDTTTSTPPAPPRPSPPRPGSHTPSHTHLVLLLCLPCILSLFSSLPPRLSLLHGDLFRKPAVIFLFYVYSLEGA